MQSLLLELRKEQCLVYVYIYIIVIIIIIFCFVNKTLTYKNEMILVLNTSVIF